MYFGSIFYAAALCAGIAKADFMVYTEPPIPTSAIPTFSNPSDAADWTTSVFLNARVAYGSLTKSAGSTFQSSLSSALSEVSAFAATASNYSIPAAVTDNADMTTFFSKPDWYTALPTGARAFKESQVSDQFSIIRNVIGSRQTTSSSKGAAPAPTPRAGLGIGFGAMAAVAAGVFL
ncbi:hypothetical protein K458DRAFT_343584 [Lentithecium fluviatile CBS 122367]|uniref:Uncharacterized protein n=1 Tax=Lentithecium fluviatile CBS 122367 TaxID=1168545 RepID=A0A6G1IT59_9PLEO|nr:hypothetical protein K458DRAFT_343584 [Lentithecium fluviatile CBS 122367]